MAIRDFISERRVVLRGARRFVVRKPTIETVASALALFEIECRALAIALRENPDSLAGDSIGVGIGLACQQGDTRAASLLATCCELVDGKPGEFEEVVGADHETARALFHALVEVCDVKRIAANVEIGATGTGQEGPSTVELALLAAAERFGCAPTVVMGWPYELFLTICESYGAAAERAPEAARFDAVPSIPGMPVSWGN